MIARGANLLVCGTSMIFKPDVSVGEKLQEVRRELDKKLVEIK